MRYIFKFPDIGEGITEGRILEWLARVGQEVKEGDPLVKMETDKVVADIPSPKKGRIIRLFGQVGEIANVDEALVELDIEGTEEQALAAEAAAVAATGKTTKVEEKGFGVVGEIEDAGEGAFLPATGEGLEEDRKISVRAGKKALATPVARAMARDLGLDINDVNGSGPGGRVMKNDITRFFEENRQSPAPPPVKDPFAAAAAAGIDDNGAGERVTYEDLTQVRKSIAARMVQAKQNAPHLTAMEKVEVSRLVELRRRYREAFEAANDGAARLTYLPFVIKAVCAALAEHPILNGRLEMDKNRFARQNFINIGVAVDSPDGLIVPVIKDADKKPIRALALEIVQLAEKARNRKLTLDEIRGGTFSITNYGSIAGTYGTPIINYPEVAILGIGRIADEPVVAGGEIVPGKVLRISLSADHRIVDGAEAARFLKRVMDLLADPTGLLLV